MDCKEKDREERIKGTELFIQNQGIREAAEFICNLQDAVDGLQKNNKSFQTAFGEMLDK